MKKYSVLAIALALASVISVYWYDARSKSYRQPGYTSIACIEKIAPGESCIQREITEEERKILMGDDVFDVAGYVRTRNKSGYISLIDSAVLESRRITKKGTIPRLRYRRSVAVDLRGPWSE